MFLLVWFLLFGGPDPIRVQVTPHVGFAPVDIRVLAKLTPNADNRVLILALTSDDAEERLSERPIDGINGPNLLQLTFDKVGSGNYLVKGWVIRTTGRFQAASQKVEIRALDSSLDFR